jgi:sugar phosphate isomerase/epimerase
MKYIFSTGCLYYLPIEEIFLLAREACFDGCEVVIDQRFMSDGYLDRVVACLDILPVHTVHAPFLKMKKWGTKVDELKRAIDIARILGAGVVNFHPPAWLTMEITFAKWLNNIDDFQRELDCGDIALTIENMPRAGKRLMLESYLLNDINDLVGFGCAHNLYFTFDSTHLATFGNDIIAPFIKVMRTGRLRNIHLSDHGNHKSHLFLGRGDLPIARFLNTLRRLGYEGMITYEVSPRELPMNREWLVKLMAHQARLIRLHTGADLE